VHRHEDAYFPGIEQQSVQIADSHNYTVRRGDTPSSIATRFGISPSRLMDANGISNARYLRVGATLVIPASQMTAMADRPRRSDDSAAEGRASIERVSDTSPRRSAHSRRHRLRRGETLGHVADHYDVPVRALMRANGIENPRRVRAGTMLVIPSI
jgi:LysM repeat protein